MAMFSRQHLKTSKPNRNFDYIFNIEHAYNLFQFQKLHDSLDLYMLLIKEACIPFLSNFIEAKKVEPTKIALTTGFHSCILDFHRFKTLYLSIYDYSNSNSLRIYKMDKLLDLILDLP